ncbi:uncharacterized protein LOC141820464 [Curcuma longa]|uniref:uncharacterized protein LOC141820464 n=1 Tax=Curcuma longa TaxID=136217 RepID=UPI003D9FAFE7
MFPSAEELQVELTLLELADLILERRRIPPPGDHLGSLRWRGGKPRSVASRRRRPLPTLPPPSPLDGKEGDAAAATAASSSPTTPLSFQESGSEEASVRPDPEAEQRKRHRELIAREDRKSFSNASSSIFSYQSRQPAKRLQQQREVTSAGGGATGPTAVDPRSTVGGHREQQSVGAVAGLPDLNARAAEEEQLQRDPVRWSQHRQQQQMAYRAATSLARRRRVRIQREKRFSLLSYNSK